MRWQRITNRKKEKRVRGEGVEGGRNNLNLLTSKKRIVLRGWGEEEQEEKDREGPRDLFRVLASF